MVKRDSIRPLLIILCCFGVIGISALFQHFNDIERPSQLDRTTLLITNSSDDNVQVYLTLGGGVHYIKSVKGVFGIKTAGTQGFFTLRPHDTLSYLSPVGKGFSGNFTFATPPLNCATSLFPNGINIFEATLNNRGTVPKAQETVDISCVSGVNAQGRFHLNGGGEWIATTGVENIKTFYNDSLYHNDGLVGVFPYGCDDCTKSVSPPHCKHHKKYATPQKKPICNISRNANLSGGTVLIEYITML